MAHNSPRGSWECSVRVQKRGELTDIHSASASSWHLDVQTPIARSPAPTIPIQNSSWGGRQLQVFAKAKRDGLWHVAGYGCTHVFLSTYTYRRRLQMQPKDWKICMNKKERRLALATALHSAAVDMLVVDKVAPIDVKTKNLVAMLEGLGCPADVKTLLIVKEASENLLKAGSNIATLAINTADCISVFDVLHADKILVDQAALEHINAFYSNA
eukprot:365665-Chlamydomonas_euryale.AAC.4